MSMTSQSLGKHVHVLRALAVILDMAWHGTQDLLGQCKS